MEDLSPRFSSGFPAFSINERAAKWAVPARNGLQTSDLPIPSQRSNSNIAFLLKTKQITNRQTVLGIEDSVWVSVEDGIL